MAEQYYIGLLSGTSIDSMDAALVQFPHASECVLCQTHSEPTPTALKNRLHEVACAPGIRYEDLAYLEHAVAMLAVRAVACLLEKCALNYEDITAIGSHGQTIQHGNSEPFKYTLQIGDPNIIAVQTGIPTIGDFRRADMAAGGLGAPLSPLFHDKFMRSSKRARAIINIGGICNITVLDDKPPRGYDCGPGNTLLDAWMRKCLNVAFDYQGSFANRGNCLTELLSRCLNDPYFKQSPPKSTGPEYFNLKWLKPLLPTNVKQEDVQHTLAELTAQSIAGAIHQWHPNIEEVIFCGGGVHNTFLMARLSCLLNDYQVATTSEIGIDPDWVEACFFAWLAKCRLENHPFDLSSITGATKPITLGAIY